MAMARNKTRSSLRNTAVCRAVPCRPPPPSQSLQSTRDTAAEGSLPAGQPHALSSWTAKEAAGGGNGEGGATTAVGGSGDVASPANPGGGDHLSPPGGDGAAAAAARWGAGLSEQVQTVLNHGRAKVNGVVTRYSHLQHVQVRTTYHSMYKKKCSRRGEEGGGEARPN